MENVNRNPSFPFLSTILTFFHKKLHTKSSDCFYLFCTSKLRVFCVFFRVFVISANLTAVSIFLIGFSNID